MTLTSAPIFFSRETKSAALYAAIPACDPKDHTAVFQWAHKIPLHSFNTENAGLRMRAGVLWVRL